MNQANQKASIIIPTYNAGDYLKESIQSALNQTYRDIEIIVIDDGSTDSSIENLPLSIQNKIKIISQTNQGKPAALNRALDSLDTSYYCILDADDTISKIRVSAQIEAINNLKVSAIFCGHQLIYGNRLIAPRNREKNKEQCKIDIEQFSMPGHDPTALYNFNALNSYRYRTKYRYCGEGYDYILRIGERHPIASIKDCLYNYRIHSNSITRTNIERRFRLIHSVQNDARKRRGLKQIELKLPDLSSNCAIENNISTHFLESVTDQVYYGNRTSAIKTALFCAGIHPTDLEYWKPFAQAILPNSILNHLGRLSFYQHG